MLLLLRLSSLVGRTRHHDGLQLPHPRAPPSVPHNSLTLLPTAAQKTADLAAQAVERGDAAAVEAATGGPCELNPATGQRGEQPAWPLQAEEDASSDSLARCHPTQTRMI